MPSRRTVLLGVAAAVSVLAHAPLRASLFPAAPSSSSCLFRRAPRASSSFARLRTACRRDLASRSLSKIVRGARAGQSAQRRSPAQNLMAPPCWQVRRVHW
jgi:hypothetical protein